MSDRPSQEAGGTERATTPEVELLEAVWRKLMADSPLADDSIRRLFGSGVPFKLPPKGPVVSAMANGLQTEDVNWLIGTLKARLSQVPKKLAGVSVSEVTVVQRILLAMLIQTSARWCRMHLGLVGEEKGLALRRPSHQVAVVVAAHVLHGHGCLLRVGPQGWYADNAINTASLTNKECLPPGMDSDSTFEPIRKDILAWLERQGGAGGHLDAQLKAQIDTIAEDDHARPLVIDDAARLTEAVEASLAEKLGVGTVKVFDDPGPKGVDPDLWRQHCETVASIFELGGGAANQYAVTSPMASHNTQPQGVPMPTIYQTIFQAPVAQVNQAQGKHGTISNPVQSGVADTAAVAQAFADMASALKNLAEDHPARRGLADLQQLVSEKDEGPDALRSLKSSIATLGKAGEWVGNVQNLEPLRVALFSAIATYWPTVAHLFN